MLLTESGRDNLNLEFAWNKVRKSILKFKLFEWTRLLLRSLEKSINQRSKEIKKGN